MNKKEFERFAIDKIIEHDKDDNWLPLIDDHYGWGYYMQRCLSQFTDGLHYEIQKQ